MNLTMSTAELVSKNPGRKPPQVMGVAMTLEIARRVFKGRPISKYAESRWGGDHLPDDTCLLLNNQAKRCWMCSATTITEFLQNGICPDCDGRTEFLLKGQSIILI